MEKQMSNLKKKMNNCFITKDYKLFTKTKGNRPINAAHVEKIEHDKNMFHVKQENFTINSTDIRHIDVITVR